MALHLWRAGKKNNTISMQESFRKAFTQDTSTVSTSKSRGGATLTEVSINVNIKMRSVVKIKGSSVGGWGDDQLGSRKLDECGFVIVF